MHLKKLSQGISCKISAVSIDRKIPNLSSGLIEVRKHLLVDLYSEGFLGPLG